MALFARVLQYGSFSEAARRVGIPVSSLSRKISALEQELGVRLLERTTRSLSPTETGRAYLGHCQQLLDAMEGAEAVLQQRKSEVAGVLRLAAPPSLSEVLLVPLLEGFLKRYPKVSVKVLVSDQHLDLVNDEVDLSLRVGRQAESSLVVRRLVRYRHVLVAAPSYKSTAKLERPEDLQEHRLIGFSKWFEEVRWTLSNGAVRETMQVQLAIGMNDYAGVRKAALAGMGVAEMPGLLCRDEIAQGRLVPVLPGWQFDEVDLSAYYLTRRHPVRVVELFLDHCTQQLRGGAGRLTAVLEADAHQF